MSSHSCIVQLVAICISVFQEVLFIRSSVPLVLNVPYLKIKKSMIYTFHLVLSECLFKFMMMMQVMVEQIRGRCSA